MSKYLSLVALLALLMSTDLFAQNHVLHLDGEGDHVALPCIIISGNEFTIEGWANMEGTGGGLDHQNTIFSQRDYATGTGALAILLNAESPVVGNMIRFNIRSTLGSNNVVEHPANNYGAWHHFAGVVSVDSVYLFLDGQKVDATSNTHSGNYSQSVELIEIGRHFHADSYLAGFFNGYIDDLRIWGGALNDIEIQDVKNGHLQYVQSSLDAEWDFEGSLAEVLDQSGNNHTGSLMGDATIIEMDIINLDFGYSLFLDGIDDYASLSSPIVHSTQFTVEVWAAMLGGGGGLDQQNTLFSQRDYDTEANRPAILLTAENIPFNSESRFAIRSNVGVTDAIGSPAPIYDEWHHYTGVLSSDSLYLYIDGQLVSTGENHQVGVFDYSIDIMDFGRHFHSVNYPAGYFNGYIDEIKVWSVARTLDQIQADMTSQITGIDSTLAGYYNFDNGFVEDLSGTGNSGELINGAAIVIADLNPGGCQVTGDVNGSGAADVSDVIELVYQIIGLPVNDINADCADISGDEMINISDVILLVDYLLEN